MDGRVCLPNGEKWIVQAKRWQNNSALVTQMKEEKLKMDRVTPQRYFLVGASSMNPDVKEKILEAMNPYILSTSDIYGAEDIAALLDEHLQIYKKHYKLWLNSVHELNFIKNNEYYNRSSSELDRIVNELKYFVSNDAVEVASKILNQTHYLLIQGDPGSGKSITAGHLALQYFLEDEAYEFHFIRDRNLRGVIDLIQKGTNQIFILDDFLGASFLHTQDILSTASDLQTLVHIASKSDGKLKLIFTSRDYIIKQFYSKTDDEYSLKNLFVKSTSTITLEDPIFRANLIYSYFSNSKLTPKQKENFINTKLYFTIIKHDNFNPRFLKQIFENGSYLENENISSWCILQLNEPEKIWQKPFMTLSYEAQTIIYILSLIESEVTLENLRDEYEILYHKIYGKISSSFDFDNALDELEPNFINSFNKGEFISYTVANGGIRDFIHTNLSKNKLLVNTIIENFKYFDFGTGVFGFSLEDNKPIQLTDQQKEILNKKLLNLVDNEIDKISIIGSDEQGNRTYKIRENSIGGNLTRIWQIVSKDKVSASFTIQEIEKKLQDETILLNIIKTQRLEPLIQMIENMTPIFQSKTYKLIVQNMTNSEDAVAIAKAYKTNKIFENIINTNRNKIIKQMQKVCIEEIQRVHDQNHIETIVRDIYTIEEVFKKFDVPSSIYDEKLHEMFTGTYDYPDDETVEYIDESNSYVEKEIFLEKLKFSTDEIDGIFLT